MTIYPRSRRAERVRFLTPEMIEAAKEWTCKPFTPRASIIVPAVAGAVAFVLFVIIGLST